MHVMKSKTAVQLCLVRTADRIVRSLAPGRRNEPAKHDARNRPDHTDSFQFASSPPHTPRARASRAPSDSVHIRGHT